MTIIFSHVNAKVYVYVLAQIDKLCGIENNVQIFRLLYSHSLNKVKQRV